jgi:hypothetical protein
LGKLAMHKTGAVVKTCSPWARRWSRRRGRERSRPQLGLAVRTGLTNSVAPSFPGSTKGGKRIYRKFLKTNYS